MKSFLLIGQSNMAGRGFVHEVPQSIMKESGCCATEDGR